MLPASHRGTNETAPPATNRSGVSGGRKGTVIWQFERQALDHLDHDNRSPGRMSVWLRTAHMTRLSCTSKRSW